MPINLPPMVEDDQVDSIRVIGKVLLWWDRHSQSVHYYFQAPGAFPNTFQIVERV